jgi:DNA polymerase
MADARRIVRQRLESLKRAGVTNVPKSRGKGKQAAASDKSSAASPATSRAAAAPNASEKAAASRAGSSPPANAPAPVVARESVARSKPLSLDERVAALKVVEETVRTCMRCPALCTTRTQTVFGVGNPQTKLVFLGEAPGADEDEQGEPFVGRAGQLLNKIIEACTLKREDVYILNTLKCRPPNNRPPESDEMANCREYLDAQLDIIRPEFVCCLGATGAKAFFQDENLSIGRIRGKLIDHRGVKVMCTYHPAYLLRNPAAKRDVWDDMKVLMKAMGVKLPG